MDTRIRELRRALGMTQQELADKLGIGRTIISNYEIGRSSMSDAVLRLIVTTFGVSEIWLYTGEGDMFRSLSRREELADFAGDVLAGNVSHSVEALVLLVKRLPESVIDLAMDELRRILAEQDAENSKAAPSGGAAERKTMEG